MYIYHKLSILKNHTIIAQEKNKKIYQNIKEWLLFLGVKIMGDIYFLKNSFR